MIRTFLFAALALAAASVPAIAADNFVVKDAGAVTITKRSKDVGAGVQADANLLLNSSFAVVNPATSDRQPAIGAAGTPAADVISVQGVAGGTPQAITAITLPLPAGAATSAKQAAPGTAGSASADVLSVQGVAGGTPQPVDSLSHAPATDRGGTITAANTSQVLMAANATRRGYALQNQSTADLYICLSPATADFHCLKVAASTYFETSVHASVGAIGIIGSTAGQAFYAREW